jgi:hypothetical protein
MARRPGVDRSDPLQALPNIGPATAADLHLLGITRPEQLKGRDPFELYERLCRKTGRRHDPCLLDVFIATVRFVEGAPALPWWHYTAERKQHQAARKSSQK